MFAALTVITHDCVQTSRRTWTWTGCVYEASARNAH